MYLILFILIRKKLVKYLLSDAFNLYALGIIVCSKGMPLGPAKYNTPIQLKRNRRNVVE